MPLFYEFMGTWLGLVRSRTEQKLPRDLGTQDTDLFGVLSPQRGRMVLIVALICASISLIAALITLRWFVLMKRSFRHQLIMLLLISDTFKALWYLIFPIVVFIGGPVESSSNFCQASGFFLAFGIEAADFAIFMVATHLILYAFRLPKTSGEGGLYRYRFWIYPFWIILPLLAASIAFTNSANAYVATGTFCYLPERPIWYSLALAWVPRYILFLLLFSVAIAITVNVHIEFKHFSRLQDGELSYEPGSRRSTLEQDSLQRGTLSVPSHPNHSLPRNLKPPLISPGQSLTTPDRNRVRANSTIQGSEWEVINIGGTNLTTSGKAECLQSTVTNLSPGSRILPQLPKPDQSVSNRFLQEETTDRKHSEALTLGKTESRVDSNSCATVGSTITGTVTQELETSRYAIERHLRLLFLYPVVYLLMWLFPFISHCLQYSQRYAANQPFWLDVIVIIMLALQASADAAVFSYRERPWRRARGRTLISAKRLRRLKFWSLSGSSDDREGGKLSNISKGEQQVCDVSTKRDSLWWEAEGKKRRDSVWMGTDKPYLTTRGVDDDATEEHKETV